MSENNDVKKITDFLKGTPKKPQPKAVPVEKKPIKFKQIIPVAIVVTSVFALLIIAIANIYIVRENEYKVVRQFGEVVKFEKKPGLYMTIPFIQSVSTLPSNQQIYDISEEEMNTKDKKRIIIDNYAVWRITDPKALISNAGTLTNAEQRMEEFIYSTIRNEVGQLEYGEIINDEKSSRGDLNGRVTKKVNDLLAQDQYGVEVVDVRIRRTDLPKENEQAIYTRMISERQSTAQRYLSEGDASKRRIEAQTDKEVQELLSTANKEAALIIAAGEEEAGKIYNEAFSKDPEFYSMYRTLESYKRTIGEDTMIILPAESPYARMLTGQTK
ncbi:protein HflC [Lysinibacillus alkalisoli]|uniref:Protein HflC n=1 Tax=Lysinibacillus alkalisoli TaxID=1911548 RepID=A0A917LJA8_9BACI|nr:protease modulator HflC [Lysinibacillus alkalisoli]GGG29724.1 protein HflC [Lysinibacillus alkalisoli]